MERLDIELRSVSVRSVKTGTLQNDRLGELRRLIAMVVEDTEGGGRPNRKAIKVGEHLLAPLKANVEKQHYRDRFVADIRILL